MKEKNLPLHVCDFIRSTIKKAKTGFVEVIEQGLID